ncbi:MFS transporter [Brevibacillus choshinensis]|uniref:MFS transporter n=1 Tax=Brevibacillus choshinensis TaxID=54911 RepID=UPI002E239156|nr:MFS transporter [Brevibacillus choshinensis]MED4752963.1 MFS transporter [Brevibacillus choshinensis]MED4781461.1 MFS transporter [Brevibacillus choshinensis]
MSAAVKKVWGYRYVILFILWLLYIINYFDRVAVLTFLPFIQKDMELSPVQVGQIASAFFFAYAIGQVTSGFLADKFGPKKVMNVAIITFTFITFITGFVKSFGQFIAIRIGLGLGEAHHFPPAAKAISSWFPYAKRGTALSIFNTSNYVGLALVPIVLTNVSAAFFDGQWRPVFYALAVPGIIGILLLWYFFSDTPEEMYKKGRLSKEELDVINDYKDTASVSPNEKVSNKIYLKDRTFYIVCLIQFCQIGILWGLTTWLSTFLVKQHDFTITQMGLLASAPPVVSIVSILMGGRLMDKCNRMKPVALIAYLGCIPVLWMIGSVEKGNTAALVTLLLLSGFFVAFNSGAITASLQKRYPSAVVGGATGIVNGFGQLGAFMTPLVAGYLVTVGTGGSFDFSKVFIYFSFLAGLAAVCALFLKESPIQMKESARSSDVQKIM